MVRCLPTMRETQVRSLGREDPLEKEMATHSSILGWKIPLRILVGYSPWSHKECYTTERLHFQFPVTLGSRHKERCVYTWDSKLLM